MGNLQWTRILSKWSHSTLSRFMFQKWLSFDNDALGVLHTSLFFFRVSRDGEELAPCNKIDMSVRTSNGMTALHLAAQGGFVRALEQLLDCRHKWWVKSFFLTFRAILI